MSINTDLKILLVEDSPSTRKMEVRIIQKLGFETVEIADDGAHAQKLMEDGLAVDLVISDWNMPNMDGMQLLQWLRSTDKYKDIPFIMATGQAERSQAKIAMDAGANGVVAKPFSPADLTEILETIEEHGTAAKDDDSIAVREPIVGADGKVKFQVAHIQITDHLVLGVLKEFIDSGKIQTKYFDLETLRMPSWNPVQKKMEEGELDGAFLLAPIAMETFSYGVPMSLIMLAHKNGSIMVRNRNLPAANKEAMIGKTFYLPHQLSVHHMLTHMYFSEMGLNSGLGADVKTSINFEIVPPIKMPEFLGTNPDAAGFMVAEPLGTKAISSNIADLTFLSAEVWKNHPCCVVTFRDEVIEQHPLAVQEFCRLLADAGRFIKSNPGECSEIAVKFLDPEGTLKLSAKVLKNILTEEAGISTEDLYPVVADLQKMNDYMTQTMGVGTPIDVNKFVNLQFAEVACAGNIPAKDRPSSLEEGQVFKKAVIARAGDSMTKRMLDKEGKYLLFMVNGEKYGLGIMQMKEIIGMREVTTMPNKPKWFRGVLDLRGKIVPVMDLSIWFGEERMEDTEKTTVVIVETRASDGSEYIGIVVDEVEEIADVTADNVESMPAYTKYTKYVLALAKLDKSVNILLDIDHIIEDTATVSQ